MTNLILEMKKFNSECWANIFTEVHGAVVYIDQYATECLHWYTAGKGYTALRNVGAIAVHELGMYHFLYSEVKNSKKAVIVSTAGDPAFYQRTIKMILAKNTFDSCTIYCSVPCCTTDYPGVHLTEEKLNYIKLKRDIKIWMASRNPSQDLSVNIIHIPLLIAPLNDYLFVTPAFGDFMPPLDTNVTEDMLPEISLLANSFYKLFDSINAKLDTYSVGKFSSLLAENLENHMANGIRQNRLSEVEELGVSLILIDRTLDLCTPSSNNVESFLTKILRAFPRLPQHNNDIAIKTSPVFGTIRGILRAHEVPGCLANLEKTTIDLFILENEKKLLAVANQSLNNMASTKDSPKLRNPMRISGHSLEKALGKIQVTNKIDSVMVHTEKVQSILAIVEASTSQKTSQFELLTSLEKLVLQNLSVSRESSSILTQLSNIIRTRIHRGLDIENLFALLIHVYALAGTQIQFSSQQEQQLEESIADAIFEDYEVLKRSPSTNTISTYRRTLQLLVNDVVAARETSYKIAASIIHTLRSVANQRSTLQDYKFLMIKAYSQETNRPISILEQITRDIISPGTVRELRDLRQRSSSLISAGFNLLLRGKVKRHARDNPYILIYIIGGFTAEEAKLVQDTTAIHNKNKTPCIILAGSRLLNPLDVVEKIFFK
ncbi:PREDICTED: sec1 family domain-containing protein 2-like isoform X2 [Dufourea novaeangliae]|uniref:sec1 family domain-containing protein 2-like isoform X2 n=1 Tax=Dufourea novaeangliae TaxID=178035 RepID=UPI000767DDC8|nr:PREDICTED: sec1 family domain-containing protein 2-like isoform X2 [Dufourea novaeangliae]